MASSHQKGLAWPHLLFAVFLFVVLGLIFTPVKHHKSLASARTKTLNNAKAIAGGLVDVKSITPLVIAPIKAKGEVPLFDRSPYADYYVYGAVDGSGKQGKIGKNGLPLSKGRTHLFQAGTDSLFGDQTPVVKYPLGL